MQKPFEKVSYVKKGLLPSLDRKKFWLQRKNYFKNQKINVKHFLYKEVVATFSA